MSVPYRCRIQTVEKMQQELGGASYEVAHDVMFAIAMGDDDPGWRTDLKDYAARYHAWQAELKFYDSGLAGMRDAHATGIKMLREEGRDQTPAEIENDKAAERGFTEIMMRDIRDDHVIGVIAARDKCMNYQKMGLRADYIADKMASVLQPRKGRKGGACGEDVHAELPPLTAFSKAVHAFRKGTHEDHDTEECRMMDLDRTADMIADDGAGEREIIVGEVAVMKHRRKRKFYAAMDAARNAIYKKTFEADRRVFERDANSHV